MLGVLVTLALVAQFIVDGRLVARAFAVRISPGIFNCIGGVGKIANLLLDNLMVVPAFKLIELARPQRSRYRVHAKRRIIRQVFFDDLSESCNLFFGIFRLFDVELVAQTNPYVWITAIAGGDVFEIRRRIAFVIAGSQDRT